MELTKKTSISLLSEMLNTYTNTRLFAEHKLKYIDSSLSIRHGAEFNEYMDTKHRCEVKINQIEACITWLKQLENEKCNNIPKAETKDQ